MTALLAVRSIQFELDPGPGIATLDLLEPTYRQARALTDRHGCRLRIKRVDRGGGGRRPGYHGWELRVDGADGQAIAVRLSQDQGTGVSDTARRLIEYAHGVLREPLPW